MDYKEKLEEAKRLYETANADQRYVLENLFPELKESEGEKIRKRIIDALHGDVLDIEEIDKAIAWLEKQGEKGVNGNEREIPNSEQNVFTPDEVKKEREKMQFTWQDLYDAVMFGAQSQKAKDQSTIELAEDHAMLAGMEKMKEEMMKKAIDGYVIEDIEEGNGDFLLSAEYIPKSMGLKDQQKVKVIVIRED